MLLFRTRPLPGKSGKTRYAKVSRIRFAPTSPALQPRYIGAFSLQPHKTTIVLPDFSRSCSAVGGKREINNMKALTVNNH